MTKPIIETPRGKIIQNGKHKSELVWNTNFQPKWQRNFTQSQKFVDSEVLRKSEPYTPLLTGVLIKSGILATVIGSGLVRWIAPYARKQYYTPRKAGSQTGALRGPFWFERMKKVDGKKIIAGAKRIAGKE